MSTSEGDSEGAVTPPTIEQVVSELAPFIRRTLRGLHVRAADVDDVMQQVLLATHRRLATFDPRMSPEPESAIRGLLFRICTRCAASHRRSLRRRREVAVESFDDTAAGLGDPALEPENQLLAGEREALLSELLAAIPGERREVVCAHDLRGEPMNEIASALGVPLNTAWSRRHLARRDLRAAWRRRGRAIE